MHSDEPTAMLSELRLERLMEHLSAVLSGWQKVFPSETQLDLLLGKMTGTPTEPQ